MLDAVTPALPASDAAHALVRTIRAEDTITGATTVVTGDTAFDIDFVNYIVQQTPWAVGFAMLTTHRRALPAAALGDPAGQGGADEPAVC